MPRLHIASSNPAAMYYIHTDQLNTPRLVTDTNKKRRWDGSMPFRVELAFNTHDV